MSENRWQEVRRWIRRIWLAAGVSVTAWLVWNMQAHGVPAHVRESSSDVRVIESSTHVLFEPTGQSQGTPIVFLPGGGVDPDAYLPFVRQWAEDGHPVALVYLPWRVAFTEGAQAEVWQRIEAVTNRWPNERFVLAGHSRGAALSAQFAASHADRLAGLVLIGTTHPRDHDLSRLPLPVLKVAGTRDCVAPLDDSQRNAVRLPPTTTWAVIEGANHAQFGHYGSQLGDCSAGISRDAQQTQTHEQVSAWLLSNGLAR